jgi:hypothetical protein
VVDSDVFGAGHHGEVRRTVVVSYSVDVMYHLARRQRATKHLLGHDLVLAAAIVGTVDHARQGPVSEHVMGHAGAVVRMLRAGQGTACLAHAVAR